MPPIVIVDTSVLLNVLNVPGFNQDQDTVLDRFRELVDDEANLLLPMGTVFETGNHIADIPDGRQRRRYAAVFTDQVQKALNKEAPWTLTPLPDADQLKDLLDRFPDDAMRGLGMVDLSIIKAWEQTCALHRGRRVLIWALDDHLAGYDRTP